MEGCGHIPVWAGQRVERTNARGRHAYCAAFKAWIVEQAMQPGMSMAGLAMRNQVNANQLRRWVTLHRRGTGDVAAAVKLLPVTIAAHGVAPTTTRSTDAPVEIAYACLRDHAPYDEGKPNSQRTRKKTDRLSVRHCC